MRILIMALLGLLIQEAKAQTDFDFTLHTRYLQQIEIRDDDGSLLILTAERVVRKKGNRLEIYPTFNSGETREFRVHFERFRLTPIPGPAASWLGDLQIESFNYSTDDNQHEIRIWPTIPVVEVWDKQGKLIMRLY